MIWHLVYTKPKQELCAKDNLSRQGYECYLPTIPCERLSQGLLTLVDEPLFPRYLFIFLGQGNSAKSWAPIRFTRGVCRLVNFGIKPATVDASLIEQLQTQEALMKAKPTPLFKTGDHVRLMEAPFTGIEAIYQMTDGERRAMVMLEILCKPVHLRVSPANLRKVC